MKIVSGGQTGADQGALDAAIDCGYEIGGWCPRGRRTESGPLPVKYAALKETPDDGYPQRTEWNVRDADATLILHRGQTGPGTKKTIALAGRAKCDGGTKKPYLEIDIRDRLAVKTAVLWWTTDCKLLGVINVAGPRESGAPGIHDSVYGFMVRFLKTLRGEA